MRPGLYILATIILTAIIGGLAYSVNPNYYPLEFMGFKFNFPIAIWIILPMVTLFLFTLAHMMFYGLKNYLMFKKWDKDNQSLEEALIASLLNEPIEQKYCIEEFSKYANLLSKAKISMIDSVDDTTPRLSRIAYVIHKIESGEFVDLKEEKISHIIKQGNPILIQNRLNQLKSDSDFVEKVMKTPSNYSDIVVSQSLEIFSNTQNFPTAKKYISSFDSKNFLNLLGRVSFKDSLGLNAQILSEFVNAIDLSCEEFIKIVLITKKIFKPEENLSIFHDYQVKNDKAQNAYLYLLFEYELLDKVATYLEEQEENEFIKFRVLYRLKKENSKYQLEDIIDIESICNEIRLY